MLFHDRRCSTYDYAMMNHVFDIFPSMNSAASRKILRHEAWSLMMVPRVWRCHMYDISSITMVSHGRNCTNINTALYNGLPQWDSVSLMQHSFIFIRIIICNFMYDTTSYLTLCGCPIIRCCPTYDASYIQNLVRYANLFYIGFCFIYDTASRPQCCLSYCKMLPHGRCYLVYISHTVMPDTRLMLRVDMYDSFSL